MGNDGRHEFLGAEEDKWYHVGLQYNGKYAILTVNQKVC